VAVSIRNLENIDFPSNLSYVPEHRDAIRAIRDAVAAPVVLGGGGFSVAPEAFLAAAGGDVGIVGEGDAALADLADKVASAGGLPSELRGAVIRAEPIGDLDGLSCDRTVLDQGYYLAEGGCATIQTKRGCNLGCTYCTYPLIEGTRVRTRDVELVVDEMERLHRDMGATDFTLVDSIFNNPESHALAFCEALIRRDLGVKWTAYFRPRSRDAGFFDLLARSGCSGVDATPDSLSEATLDSLGKALSPGDVEAFCAGARKRDLPVNLNFIFGAPGESPDTLRETVERIERCGPKSVIAAIGLRLYPGAAVSAELVRQGAVAQNEVGLDPLFYLSEQVEGTLVDTLRELGRRDGRWIIPGLGIRYNPRFFRRLRKHGKKGPVWKFL